MTREELENAVLSEGEFRIRRMSTNDLETEFAAAENGLKVELTATAGRDLWICPACRMGSGDCGCNAFGSEQVV